jgi:hypothetical protein
MSNTQGQGRYMSLNTNKLGNNVKSAINQLGTKAIYATGIGAAIEFGVGVYYKAPAPYWGQALPNIGNAIYGSGTKMTR